MHMFLGAYKKGKSLEGFIKNGLVELHTIFWRHESLVAEMRRRGYNHQSPMQNEHLPERGSVDPIKSALLLIERCPNCFKEDRNEMRL